MVPIGGLFTVVTKLDAGAVLGNHHGHLLVAGPSAIMPVVRGRSPRIDTRIEDVEIASWRMIMPNASNSMHLKCFDEGFFGGHFHLRLR
jgi:hypothetical protein